MTKPLDVVYFPTSGGLLSLSISTGPVHEFGYLECDVSGSGCEITVVVAAAIALALLIALIPSSLGQFLCFGL